MEPILSRRRQLLSIVEHALGLRIFSVENVLKRMESLPHLWLVVTFVQGFLYFVAFQLFFTKPGVLGVEEMHSLLDLEVRQEDHQSFFFLLLFRELQIVRVLSSI